MLAKILATLPKRDHQAAKQFFKKMHGLKRTKEPRTMNVDKNAAYPLAFSQLQEEGLFVRSKLRRKKYLNNIIEQDHRRVKWKNRHAMGFFNFTSAKRTIQGIEAMHMLFKGQIKGITNSVSSINKFVESLFGLEAVTC